MKFCEALELMKQGFKIKMPDWSGYWQIEKVAKSKRHVLTELDLEKLIKEKECNFSSIKHELDKDYEETIMMHCKDDVSIDIRDTNDIFYTLGFIMSDEWIIADETNSKLLQGEVVHTFNFGEAIRKLKQGKHVARKGWNGKGMFVVYQKGYPNGIQCNKQTAEAWGINEGDLFICNPYLQIKCTNGSHSMWDPSINDCLAEDWIEVE
jgi:hypothetical protein